MHARSIYQDPERLEFASLASKEPQLKKFLIEDGRDGYTINFQDPEAAQALTRCLLKRDFGLELLNLADDRLCPGVPGRLDYALWISEIAQSSAKGPLQLGLDIGTGATAVYALLLIRLHAELCMIGTEADSKSYNEAVRHVQHNQLLDRISVQRVNDRDPLVAPAPTARNFDFSLCNPPFYSSEEEIADLAAVKTTPKLAVCTGAPCEMVTDGGEVGFVKRMLNDGLANRVRWASSLLGKLSSVHEVVAELRRSEIDNYAIGELQQGKTRRWAVAWSLGAYRLPDSIARDSSSSLVKLLPQPNTVSTRLSIDAEAAKAALDRVFEECALHRWPWQDGTCEVEAVTQSWSRQERRKRARGDVEMLSAAAEPVLRCRFELSATHILECVWTYGKSRLVFQSFVAHCRRALQ